MENIDNFNIQAELVEAREQQRLNIPAKRLLEKLSIIPSNVEDLQRRWFWELLQNASDYNDSVDAILEIYPDKVVFKHNGNPFRPIDTENLIAPDSGKDDEDIRTKDMIGQFGTGFISTHILSAVITVEGIMKSEKKDNAYSRFQFTLDRRHFNNKDSLIKSIKESSEELSKKIQSIEYTSGDFDTIFSYDLNVSIAGIDSKQSVVKGIDYVDDILPLTLAFMPKVKSITIVNHNTDLYKSTGKKFITNNYGTNNEIEILVIPTEKDKNQEKLTYKVFQGKSSTLIISISNNTLLPYPKFTTKLFCSLPMIGSEDFSFPVVINSKEFIPKTERDGINLTANDKNNREVIADAVNAFSSLLTYASETNLRNCYHLLDLPINHVKNETDKTWYKINVIDKIKDLLLEAKIVDNAVKRIHFKDALFPFLSKDDTPKEIHKNFLFTFYKIIADFKKLEVPLEDDYPNWFSVIDFNLFPKSKYTIEMFLDELQNLSNLSSLEEIIPTPIKWLNAVLNFIIDYDISLLDKYSIIPNQLGNFCHRKDEINWDEEIDIHLFDIYTLLTDNDYRGILLHKDFEDNRQLIPADKNKNNKNLAKDIDDIFSTFDGDKESQKYLSALRKTFKWFNDSGIEYEQLKEMFKWFSSHRPQLFLETFDDEKRDQAFIIVQSGKLTSLAKLADSNLTEKDLDVISNNVHSIKELVEIVGKIGSMRNIMEHARDLLEDKLHFDYLKRIGDDVEEVFRQALQAAGISAEITPQGWGSHDFEIKNTTNGKSVYIEIKSFANGSIDALKFAISQAEKAVNNPGNFAVCLIERPKEIENMNREYIKQSLIYKEDLTKEMLDGLNDYSAFEKIRSKKGGVKLHLSLREEVRVSIAQTVLFENKKTFTDLIENIVRQIN